MGADPLAYLKEAALMVHHATPGAPAAGTTPIRGPRAQHILPGPHWLILPADIDIEPDGPIKDVNAILKAATEKPHSFELLDPDSWGGPLWPHAHVYGMVSDGLAEYKVFAAIREAPWQAPAYGLLLYRDPKSPRWKSSPLDHVQVIDPEEFQA